MKAFTVKSALLAAVAAMALSAAVPERASAQAVGSAVVSQILVEGNQRVDPATIQSYMMIRPGDTVTAASVNESLKALFETGLFRDARIEPRGDTLVVIVEENPIINRVAFEGNRTIDDATLAGAVQSQPRRVFTRARAESDSEFILESYRRTGRYAATVEPKIIELDQNRVDLVYEIDEGPDTDVEAIRFVGNTVFSDRRLRRVISTRESEWWRLFSTVDAYDPDRLELDKELIRREYQENGYPDVVVESAVAELGADREGFFLTFTIDEGEFYRFGQIDVTSSAPGVMLDDLRDVVVTREGDEYNIAEIEETVTDMQFVLGSSGQPFTAVNPAADRDDENKTIGVTYDIIETPQIYVERIDIGGNVRTLDKVIRREFELVEGDAFNAVQIQRSRDNIRSLGFFKSVGVEATEGSAEDRVVINTTVEEASTGTLSFGVGYGSGSGVAGEVTLTERNFLGRGQYVSVGIRGSETRRLGSISFTEPYFLDRDLAVGFDAYYNDIDNQDESSYSLRNIGFRPRVSFNLGPDTRLSPRYLIARHDMRNVPDDASPLIEQDEGKEWISALGFNLTHDKRDSSVEPRSGYILSLSADAAGLGGDAQYIKSVASGKAYTTLFNDDVIASVEIEGGAISGWDDYNIRTADRFFLGGDSFRGFENSGIGPRDSNSYTEILLDQSGAPISDGAGGFQAVRRNHDDALGGNLYAVARADITFPLGLPEEYGIYGGVFADGGFLYDLDDTSYRVATSVDGMGNPVFETFGVSDGLEWRAAVGASLFWESPIGPLRLNFATPLLEQDGDKDEFFRFTAGTRF